ncbi:hypothetical protein Q31a_62360 [Aureliella helgolandensis]|uniref:Uncharacterized protein n=1 Tax=Aureliella helgolandensis TaxID=2527968 RepID=A0A518GGY6_9BACT|nr:hypothetical protein Q31a_62360 [Aureliella helgolandensis]
MQGCRLRCGVTALRGLLCGVGLLWGIQSASAQSPREELSVSQPESEDRSDTQADAGAESGNRRSRSRTLGTHKPQSPESESAASEREADVLEFVREHQPKLAKLLLFLKKQNPNMYRQAMREMSRAHQRLSSLSQRDAETYQIELDLWNTRSQLRLLAAEMLIADGKSRAAHQERFEELVDLEISQDFARLKLLEERAAKQLSQIQTQLERHANGREELKAKSMKSWEARMKRQTPRR